MFLIQTEDQAVFGKIVHPPDGVMVPSHGVAASCVEGGRAAPLIDEAGSNCLFVKNHAENIGSYRRRCRGNGAIRGQVGRSYIDSGGAVDTLPKADRLKIDNFEIVVIIGS